VKVFASTGKDSLATVYLAEFEDGKMLEFVEALQPPYSIKDRWILMVSTLFGCPIKCKFCDAGGFYSGKPSAEQIFEQIDYMVGKHFPDFNIPCNKFKIQFARMGEPSLNEEVLLVLGQLAGRYNAPGLIPSISTVAPIGREHFFEELINIKDQFYPGGKFQLQFSIHSTDEHKRNDLIPIKKWDLRQIASYGEHFFKEGDRKVTLNFALTIDSTIDRTILSNNFDTRKFLVKITPVNPTYQATQNGIRTFINPYEKSFQKEMVNELESAGFEVIVSIGEVEENSIGSNCGQYIRNYLNSTIKVENGYSYPTINLHEGE